MEKTQGDARKERFADDANRARTTAELAMRAIDAVLADQERFEDTLCGSEDENDRSIYDHMHPSPQTSPGFYL